MTFDRRHIYLQWGGTLPGGEQWSCGLRLAGGNTGPDPALFPTHGAIADALAGPVGDAVQTFHQDGDTLISTKAKLTYAKLNAVDMNGHYLDDNTIERVYGTGVGGNSNAVLHPNQITLAVTLTTSVARGHASKGRFYLPCPSIAVDDTTGLISQANADSVAAAAIRFVNALSDDAVGFFSNGINVCVMSKVGSGATHEVQGVAVGRVLDTQRRRRRSIAEAYRTLARS